MWWFNEAKNSQFETFINGENWEEICNDMDAQTQYEKFDETYIMRHYNNTYRLNKDKRNRRKNERKNLKPWILPWLEDACARKNNLDFEFANAPTVENKAKYDKMNEFCAKHIDIAELSYRKKYFDGYKDNSRKQWQMINELLNRQKSNNRVNKLIDKNGKVSNMPADIAENFNANIA